MSRQEMPVFTRTYDFLTWLLPATNHFPRAHLHTFTRRLLDAAFDLRERLEEANLRQRAALSGKLDFVNSVSRSSAVNLTEEGRKGS